MEFNSFDFAIFFPLVFLLYWGIFNKNLKFIFIQSPIRKGAFNKVSNPDKIKRHIVEVERILKLRNQIFINNFNNEWNDSLFCDYSHFNKIGAEKYTNLCLDP